MELPQPYSSPPPATAAPPTSSTVLHPTIPAPITTVNALFTACYAQRLACSMQTCDEQIRQCHIGDHASNHHNQLYGIRPVNAEQVRKKKRLDPSIQAAEDNVSTAVPLAQRTFDDYCHENFIKYDQINEEEEEEECCTTPTRPQCTCNRNDQEWVVDDADLAGLLAVQKIDVSIADRDNNEERDEEGFLDIKKRSWMEAKQKTSKCPMYRSRCRICNEISEPPPAPRKPKAKPCRMIKSCSTLFIPPANLELFFNYMTSTAAPAADEHSTTNNKNDTQAADDV